MKFRLALLGLGLAGGMSAAAPAFTVHEWGTFTTVHAPDGTLLPGLEREEERLPNFVHSHEGFAPADKGWSRPVRNVTVKMETPVLYVYADRPFRLRAEVDFVGGSISQWYPQRATGEVLPPVERGTNASPVDFAAGFHGSVAWEVDVLAPGSERVPHPEGMETPQWPRARVPEANVLRATGGGEEGFLFYRGVANLELPVSIRATNGSVEIRNEGLARIPYAMVYQKDERWPAGVVWWSGSVRAGATVQVPLLRSYGDINARNAIKGGFTKALMRAGLSRTEVVAMLATWRESYFEREGLRVFWVVPRGFTDRVLPLRLEPAPRKLERVLVGRSEVVTPAFAAALERDFRANGGADWLHHRYYLAYRALMERRGVVSSSEPATLPQ